MFFPTESLSIHPSFNEVQRYFNGSFYNSNFSKIANTQCICLYSCKNVGYKATGMGEANAICVNDMRKKARR